MTLLRNVYQADQRIFFVCFCLTLLGFTFLSKELLLTEEIYIASLGDQMGVERVQAMLQLQEDWQWLGYVLIPVLYLLKFALIALCLNVGTLLFDYKIPFPKLFRLAMMAETIFLIPILLKPLWFLLVQTSFTLDDFQYFYPLSLLNLFESGSVAPWWVYPLQLANVFEVVYWLLLAYGLHRLLRTHYDRALTLVLASYLPGLLLWITVVTFLSVSLG